MGDLHLSHGSDKPMDVFGDKWSNHTERIRENWVATVSNDDTVVIPGDVSWGMKTDDAVQDFLFLDSLPGKKIISKGNHDYWWQSMKKLGEFLQKHSITTISFLYNNAYVCEDFIICGTRGWFVENSYSPQDEKIVNRESERLRLSLNEGVKLREENPHKEIICFLHYPPAYGGVECKKITDILKEYKIDRCFYGHLHTSTYDRLTPAVGSTKLKLISADSLSFAPYKIRP
ncbi:MAG: metallophosphoesterase [Eubacteriales bacterium]|nr:metallophosphoesterase [Eubacteriales bacterium]MDD4421410.1 metallophosphoesterase [Eubacteriales bacterium]